MTLGFELALKGKMELRDYQVSAAQNALAKGNTLVVMPTALGKTFVAVLVMARLLFEERSGRRPDKKFLFLAPTKPLAVQQASRMKELLDVEEEKIVVLTGETAPEKREEIWKKAKIIAATPQVVENDLLTRKMSLGDYALIVFDEAHRAVKDYAYSFIAKQAIACQGRGSEPMVLGLTASPSSDAEKVREIVENLGIKHIEIRSERDADVADYVQKVRVDFQFVDLPQEFLELRAILEEMLRENLKELKRLGFLQTAALQRISKRDLLELRAKIILRLNEKKDPVLFNAISLQARCMNLAHAIEILESQGAKCFVAFVESMAERRQKSKAVRSLLDDFRLKKAWAKADNLVKSGIDHPKMEKLARIIEDAVARNNSVIVFAHFRESVKKIAEELNKLPRVSAREFVGQAGEGGMSQKEQTGLVQEFREKRFNVLVSSSVGEEGLDIPAVDLVVFYEAVPSEIRAIQRRGRTGRVKSGQVIVLVARGTKDEAYLWISRAKEKKMKTQLEALKHELANKVETDSSAAADFSNQKKMKDFF